ncbi:PA14 domain-containing protein [Aggregatilinea lenta]|uniref:PA14 domain-containing protein n=1 Tax=Aggregatilinea lenta TaxID=913108 RepID=UPI0013C2D472|nr:PA14 domain-containing protein [Aggregatilinea lenta]
MQRPVGTLTEGQALIEYALILTLVIVSLAGILAVTGPAVGAVFSDQMLNLLGGDPDPRETLTPADFWAQVGAVASYTPQSANLRTNTPRPATSTPTTGAGGPVGTEDTGGEPVVPTNTALPTAGPSPTPTSQSYGYPFNDSGDDADRWETGFTGPGEYAYWNAEFWNWSSQCNASNFSGLADGTGVWTTTFTTIDNYWSGSPGGGVSDNFCARFKTTLNFEAGTYTWQIKKDDGIRIWVDGQLVVANNVPPGSPETWAWNPLNATTWTRDFTITTSGDKPVMVEFFDSGGPGELHIQLLSAASDDVGTCNWTLSPAAFRSAPDAWNDSPSGNYATGSRCNLKLRGDIDLTGATTASLQFWDRFTLSANTVARAEVRILGDTAWTALPVHQGAGTMGWSQQTLSLDSFIDEQIELRFVLDATSATTAADGWVIDDIEVLTPTLNTYTIGFFDNMEGASHWLAGDTWARSGERTHQGVSAWSDSPGTNYTHGTNTVLELDGIVKLSDNPEITDPEVAFWQRFALGAGDSIRLEVSTDHQTWTTLGSVIATATTNTSWTQKIISLSDYAGQDIYLRFRLDATTDSSVGDGWWIDDFAIRTPLDTSWTFGSCDNVESAGTYWTANGTWGIIAGTDSNSSTGFNVQGHSGTSFWSDSPGAQYAPSANDALEMLPWLSLPTSTVAPELVFWQQWALGAGDYIAVEVLRESTGTTWTEVWRMTNGSRPPGYNTTDSNFNYVLSWQRETVDLSSYRSDTDRLKIRFRRYSDSSNTSDGWWIDDVCFQTRTETTRTLPFTDAMNSTSNWFMGGTWWTSSEQSHDGVAFSDSPGTTYPKYANNVLELQPIIDLAGTTWPTLYYWDRHDLGANDLIKVEISVFNGTSWGNWFEIDATGLNPAPDAWTRTGTTLSWNRHQGNLTAYAGQKIRLRFRLRDASNTSTDLGDGWWVDQVSIVERYNREIVFTPASFSDTGDFTNSWWVMDGTWGRISAVQSGGTYTNVGSGSGLGAGMWTAEFYRDSDRDQNFDEGEYRGTAEVETIDSYTTSSAQCSPSLWTTGGRPCDVGLSGSDANPDDYYLIRWTRTLTVSQPTSYRLQLQSDDGLRVFVDGQQVYSYWGGRSYNSTPETALFSLVAGSHQIVIEFNEQGGSSRVKVDFEILDVGGGGMYTDSPIGNYVHGTNASMTLEGMIDLTGSVNPSLSFSQRRLRGNNDTFYVEVSTDGGYTWSNLQNYTGNTGWTTTSLPLTSYVGQRINIRFRLDARTNTGVADGWYLENIQVTGP